MTRTMLSLIGGLALLTAGVTVQPAAAQQRTLDIYVIDTEGGGLTLFVTPEGESVLIDTGNPGDRDHQRLMEVLKVAGVTKIDHLILTHYHLDHVGGLQQLAAVMPIAHFIDHGPTIEEREQVPGFQAAYAELYSKARHTVVKPGDKLPIAGLDWTIVASAGQAIDRPLPGAGQDNAAACAASPAKPFPADDENAMSVGSVIAFGQFRTAHLGDLFWAKELEFMCPVNRIGTVDLYMVSHHGLSQSGSPALVHGLRPRVAVMQNGTRKGGGAETHQILLSSPGLEDLWQLHWSYNAQIEFNPPGLFIANVDSNETIAGILTAPPPAPRGGGPGRQGGGPSAGPGGGAPAGPAPGAAMGQGRQGGGAGHAGPGGAGRGGRGGMMGAAAHTPAHYIRISAREDGTFTVTNSRNGFEKTYVKQ
ncbi:MAG: MBL fold metallo-hydrolase [Acidobacteriota bacterium]